MYKIFDIVRTQAAEVTPMLNSLNRTHIYGDLTRVIGRITTQLTFAKGITPPAKYEDTHQQTIEAYRLILDGLSMIRSGIMAEDGEKIERGSDKVLEAGVILAEVRKIMGW